MRRRSEGPSFRAWAPAQNLHSLCRAQQDWLWLPPTHLPLEWFHPSHTALEIRLEQQIE